MPRVEFIFSPRTELDFSVILPHPQGLVDLMRRTPPISPPAGRCSSVAPPPSTLRSTTRNPWVITDGETENVRSQETAGSLAAVRTGSSNRLQQEGNRFRNQR